MKSNILKKLKKEKPKSNPMEESEYCYYQSLGRALVGFEKAIILRQGDVARVTTDDILDYADIDPEEFKNVFGDPVGLLNDVHKEIRRLFDEADKMLAGMDDDTALLSIFKRFKRNAPMLRVLFALNDHSIWRSSLRNFLKSLSKDWPPYGSAEWEYLYGNFCCQFVSVLEKWETSDFSETRLSDCVRLVHIWIEADGMLGDTVEGLLGSWEVDK